MEKATQFIFGRSNVAQCQNVEMSRFPYSLRLVSTILTYRHSLAISLIYPDHKYTLSLSSEGVMLSLSLSALSSFCLSLSFSPSSSFSFSLCLGWLRLCIAVASLISVKG